MTRGAGEARSALASAHTGLIHPEDAYEEWAIAARERIALALPGT